METSTSDFLSSASLTDEGAAIEGGTPWEKQGAGPESVVEKQPLIVTPKRGLLGRIYQWKWKNIFTAITIFLGYLFVQMAFSTIGPFFPNEAAQKGSTPLLTGIIISCTPLCVAVLSPIIGCYLPQLGARFTLLSGLWLVGGSYILLSFVDSFPSGWVFIMFCILLRLTEGVGSAMFTTSVFAQLPKLFPNSVGTVNGLLEVCGGLGYAVGPPLGGVLYTVGGFRMPFLTVGGLCLTFIFPAFILMKKSSCSKQVLSLTAITKLLSNFTFLLLVLANIFAWASWSFIAPTFQPFLYSQFQLDPEHIGLVFLSAPLAYVMAAPLVGKLTDKFGPRWFVVIGSTMLGVSYFFLGPAHFISQPMLRITIIATCAFGLGSSLCVVPTFTDMLILAKSLDTDGNSEASVSVVSGITTSTLSLGEFSGSLIGGALTQVMDFPTSAMVVGQVFLAEGCLLLGATLINRWSRR